MNLRVLLPYRVFADKRLVSRIVTETRDGSFGLLPQRLDCVAPLTPGLLICETKEEGELCIAVDEGVLVKTGLGVLVSARRALIGTDVELLREAAEREFGASSREEQCLSSVMSRIETRALRNPERSTTKVSSTKLQLDRSNTRGRVVNHER